jgi:hypothetical protein
MVLWHTVQEGTKLLNGVFPLTINDH